MCAVTEAFLHANSAAVGASLAAIYQRRSRASAKPTILTLRWWSETAGWSAVGAWADESSHACSPTAECQTNLDLSVRSGIFPSGEMERQRSVAVGKWPCSRLLPCLAPGEASRCYCLSSATGGASRRIADALPASNDSWAIACWPDEVSRPLCFFGRARFVPDCLASLRPSECSGVEM